ncbi:MAG: pyridoxal-phosphate dependent enzyme [Bacteroidetes bacterium]|nr:pyridoxal-phosphate dependent enzyme [Bacteroidota bacterium]HET6244460.1 pyridoxal-phosphate dependent enzyme [Bacteroidia bacterium]
MEEANALKITHTVTPLVKYKGPVSGWKNIWLKDETKQVSNAFKFRGVAHKVGNMPKGSTVTTASTGNHGIATAIAASKLGLKAAIFVPKHTASVKKQKLNFYNAQLMEVEGEYQACVAQAKAFALNNSNTFFIHGFDDAEIIDGTRSLFHEVKKELENIPVLFVPVGGGGLLSACLLEYPIAHHKIYAVELDHAPALKISLEKGERVQLGKLIGRADGMMVDRVGESVFIACRDKAVEVKLISEKELEEAVRLLWKHNGIKAELSGASALAVALKTAGNNQACLCIVSGGNIDEEYFREIIKVDSLLNSVTSTD